MRTCCKIVGVSWVVRGQVCKVCGDEESVSFSLCFAFVFPLLCSVPYRTSIIDT